MMEFLNLVKSKIFLKSNIKVDAKKTPFSKWYLKYLRRIEIRDFIHVITSNSNRAVYELSYYKVPENEWLKGDNWNLLNFVNQII